MIIRRSSILLVIELPMRRRFAYRRQSPASSRQCSFQFIPPVSKPLNLTLCGLQAFFEGPAGEYNFSRTEKPTTPGIDGRATDAVPEGERSNVWLWRQALKGNTQTIGGGASFHNTKVFEFSPCWAVEGIPTTTLHKPAPITREAA